MALPAGLSPDPIESFNGLRLDVDPEELGFQGAVDSLNVEHAPGRVRSRSGLSVFLARGSTLPILNIIPFGQATSADQLVVTNATAAVNNLTAVNNDGTLTGFLPATLQPATAQSAQLVGTPSATYLYVTKGAGGGTGAQRWDGSTWTAVTLPAGSILGLSPTDNRLVVGNMNSPVQRSRVTFSDPDTPETFDPLNFVDLTAGDGEQIMGMAAWGNQLFVFKRSKFFVFYGNSSHFAADGTEVDDFNYRTFSNGVGLGAWGACVPGPDGVYFLDRSGIYRTTGGPAVKISQALDPFFNGVALPLFSQATFDPKQDQRMAIGWAKGRLFTTVATQDLANEYVTLVWDPQLDAWSVWTAPGSNQRFTAFAELRSSSSAFGARDVLLGSSDGTIYRLDSSSSTDNGAAFTTRYRSGFSDMGSPTREKTIRETEIVGTGNPQVAWAREFGSYSSPQSVSLDSSRRGLDRSAHVGELLSFQLSGSAPWQVQRVVPALREVRGEGEETS